MSHALENVYGSLLVVRPPVPATVNKAGANYKSEVAHLEYSPRRAYDEWLSICEAIIGFGGDALFAFEPADDPFLDQGDLVVEADGTLRVVSTATRIGHMQDVLTGRVFAANGPWVVVEGKRLRALLPNMLAHRVPEQAYYRGLLEGIAEAGGYDLAIADNPHRWEGMADVAPVVPFAGGAGKVVLTYTVSGHYDAGVGAKTMRSTREGVVHAADFAGVDSGERVFGELVYPHFHGDTVHFGMRPPAGGAKLVHYPGGLWGDGAAHLREALGPGAIVTLTRDDAVEAYAGNSRQVDRGVLIPDGASPAYEAELVGLGLAVRRVPLFELFGKAGGGPACATLYLPKNLVVPPDSPLRYSVRREEARRRRERIPERLFVDRGYFEGRVRG